MLSVGWSDGVRWGPIGSGGVISHTGTQVSSRDTRGYVNNNIKWMGSDRFDKIGSCNS